MYADLSKLYSSLRVYSKVKVIFTLALFLSCSLLLVSVANTVAFMSFFGNRRSNFALLLSSAVSSAVSEWVCSLSLSLFLLWCLCATALRIHSCLLVVVVVVVVVKILVDTHATTDTLDSFFFQFRPALCSLLFLSLFLFHSHFFLVFSLSLSWSNMMWKTKTNSSKRMFFFFFYSDFSSSSFGWFIIFC